MRLDPDAVNEETLRALIACYQRQLEGQHKATREALDLPRTAWSLCKARSLMRDMRRTRTKMNALKKELSTVSK